MNLFTSKFQQEMDSEERWMEEAARSVTELAAELGVKASWARKKLVEFFGSSVVEQKYVDDGKYDLTARGGIRFVPGGQKIWVTAGQAQLLEYLAAEHLHRKIRRNGPVVRTSVAA